MTIRAFIIKFMFSLQLPFTNKMYVQTIDSLFGQKDCIADWLYIKIFIDYSAGVHDVICTWK